MKLTSPGSSPWFTLIPQPTPQYGQMVFTGSSPSVDIALTLVCVHVS